MPLKSEMFPKPTPSWKITIESRNVFVRLAKGSQVQTQAGWLPLLARRRLACPASCELHFPAWGISSSLRSFLRGCFHGAGAGPRDANAQGKENNMDKSLLCRRALVNLTLSGKFLVPIGTPLCVKLRTHHRGTVSLILSVQL